MTIQHDVCLFPEEAWIKSSYSDGGGGECVEIAAGNGLVHIRDSKNATGPVLTLSPQTWAAFLEDCSK